MAEEPQNLVLELLRAIRADMAALKTELKGDIADLRAEMNSLRADLASDIHELRAEVKRDFKAVGEQIAGMRRALFEYHSVVVGHGVLISELDARVRRVEQHLELPPLDSH